MILLLFGFHGYFVGLLDRAGPYPEITIADRVAS